MKTKRALAAAQILLMFPPILSMAALLVRRLSLLHHLPPYTAQRIAMLYSSWLWTLWVLLIALPFAVLVTGCVTFLRSWSLDPGLPQRLRQGLAAIHADRAMLFVAAMTLTAGVVLVIVAMHMLAN